MGASSCSQEVKLLDEIGQAPRAWQCESSPQSRDRPHASGLGTGTRAPLQSNAAPAIGWAADCSALGLSGLCTWSVKMVEKQMGFRVQLSNES